MRNWRDKQLIAGFLLGAAAGTVALLLLFASAREAPGEAPSPPAAAEAAAEPALSVADQRRRALELLAEESYLEAFEAADAVRRLEPSDPAALYVQAAVRLRMGQQAKSLALLEQAIESPEAPDDAYALLARLHEAAGDTQRASRIWELGISRSEAPERLEHLRRQEPPRRDR